MKTQTPILPQTAEELAEVESMLAAGIEEAPLAVMRLKAYVLQHGTYAAIRSRGGPELTAYQRLSKVAAHTKRTLAPEWAAYFSQRNTLRQLGGDPATVPVPHVRERPDERRARLLALDLTTAPHPSTLRAGDRSADAVAARAAYKAELAEAKRLQAQHARSQREVERIQTQLDDALRRRLARSKDTNDPVLRRLHLSLEGAHLRSRPWAERAASDLALLAERGIEPVVAERHPMGHVPMPMRGHHPES